MPLASQGAAGLRATSRKVSNLFAHSNGPGLHPPGGGTSTRSIHTSTFSKHAAQTIPRSVPGQTAAQKLFTHSRNFLSNVFAQLAAPGLRVPTHAHIPHGGSHRSLMHTSSTHGPTIQQGFSYPTRLALQSGARSNVFLPRGPPAARSVAHVGLGTARNFSSTRMIFQDLVENVPIVGRALYEADLEWDQKMRMQQEKMKRTALKGKENVKKGKEMLKAKESKIIKSVIQDSKATEPSSEEMEHYFPAAPVAPVTTYLLIPLAPTPSTRLPLSTSSTSTERLLPFPQLASIHATHSTHALRVSTLFTRLDQALVWERGVKCSAYGQGPENKEGTCTVLKVEFVGWKAAEVRGVIGESGTGWCVLEEVHEDESEIDEDTLSDVSEEDLFAAGHPTGMDMPETLTVMDPAQSFILPTLDFSSSFISSASPSRTPSEIEFTGISHYSDPWASPLPSSPSLSSVSSLEDMMSVSEFEGWVPLPDPPSENGWFASRIIARRQSVGRRVEDPAEDMFY